ncbi:hypothetical protein M422DRAFT_219410 [Sphaerobolus stellatus SS14]|nr:hypothetical protein M422DRAFT_219410 [Sphaerobolus stellatus SS14]
MAVPNNDSLSDDDTFFPPSKQTLSLLSARRPSLAGPIDSLSPYHRSTSKTDEGFLSQPVLDGVPAIMPDLSRELKIKMHQWVGDGTCKMSISPSGRDVVLATRSGLYIIDLEAPREVPRFLPQGGTWDVADVQWNPHPSHANYVVSTSSEKLLIWNLDRPDREAIQFILPRHYRSITDLNWHHSNPVYVASTSIDSWIWMWDLRTPAKPVAGLCAFNPGATQVKWNRHNENILASSHGNMVLIWDQRKGAMPLTRIKAHTARIHGIDWSRKDEHELVSCSLDQTIKFWNTSTSHCGAGDAIPRPLTEEPTHTPRRQIDTKYPVWRARHTPFGTGVLSLPLRGMRRPELFYEDKSLNIIPESVTDEGQADIVKEFVWRVKGGLDLDYDNREFQLVTWSEDRTLRAWSIDASLLERAGFAAGSRIEDPSHHPTTKYISYRAVNKDTNGNTPPHTSGILGGIRIGRASVAEKKNSVSQSSKQKSGLIETIRRGATMTKGTNHSKKSSMHALTWMPSVTVGEKKEANMPVSMESSFSSVMQQKMGSLSDQGSQSPQALTASTDTFDSEVSQYWEEELSRVVNGLSATKMAKISLEKVDLKRRTCTLLFQGPWGETSSVFSRVAFEFPPDYPRPGSEPSIELEKNHLIPNKRRAYLLRELRTLRRRTPCLEACLRFLLGLPNRRGITGNMLDTDSGSSSEGEDIATRPNKEPSMATRGQTGLAEPRTSQGVFGPNGEMVFVFSHTPLRMVKAIGHSPSRPSRTPVRNTMELNQASGMLSDAVRRLTAVAHDRDKTPPVATGADEDLIRTLESLAQPRTHYLQESAQSGDARESTVLVRPVRKSRVIIRDVSEITGLDRVIAQEYLLSANDPGTFCHHNASVARAFGRVDHERVFTTLYALLGDTKELNETSEPQRTTALDWRRNNLSKKIIFTYLEELRNTKDIIMLAMISIALFASEKILKHMGTMGPAPVLRTYVNTLPRQDYFSVRRVPGRTRLRASSTASHISQSSPTSPMTPAPSTALSSSTSSRSSWSSLANGVRFLVGGQEGSLTPKPQSSPVQKTRTLPFMGESSLSKDEFSLGPKTPENIEKKSSPPSRGSQKQGITLKSWSEPVGSSSQTPPTRVSVSFASAGNNSRQTTPELPSPWPHVPPRRLAIHFHGESEEDHVVGNEFFAKLSEHVFTFAEYLFRWQLFHKRTEILKCLPNKFTASVFSDVGNDQRLVTIPLCRQCGVEIPEGGTVHCALCGSRSQKPSCSVCRLPVTGLAHVCLVCSHTTHLRCWQGRTVKACPTGCGCDCLARGGFDVDANDQLLSAA